MQSSLQQSTGTNTYVEVVPLTLHIGAEICGVDLSKPLTPEQLKEVRDAFLKWKVVFFRGQNLDHAQHVAMARQFDEPTIGHAVFGHVEGHPEIYSVAKNRTVNDNRDQMMMTPWSGWHTDITAAINPPCARTSKNDLARRWAGCSKDVVAGCRPAPRVNRGVCRRCGRTRSAAPPEYRGRSRSGSAYEGVDDRNTRRSIAPARPHSLLATPGLRSPDEDRPVLNGRPSLSLPIQAPVHWI
jgi:hypothetical protein